MILRNWTRQTISVAWAIGLTAEAALVGANVISNRRADADWAQKWEQVANASPSTRQQRDSALGLLRDRTGIEIHVRNDTIVALHVPPATARAFGTSIASISGELREAIAIGLAIYLTIPLALVILTVLWYRARRSLSAPQLSRE